MSDPELGVETQRTEEEASGGYFPFGFVHDFLRFLKEHESRVEVITYRDLPWHDDFDYAKSYPREWKRWKKELGEVRSKQKIYVLLQHDVDSVPERTLRLLREEDALGLRSNVMIFRERVDRRHFVRTGEVRVTPYEIDHEWLAHLEGQRGFVVAYHANAYERASFDREEAARIFEDDVAELRRRFRIDFFSPHGGPPGPDGESNNSVGTPPSLSKSLRWVANRHTLRLDGGYSDGGINSPKRDPVGRDPRDFVRLWRPGGRYRVLLHPQYYHSPPDRSPRMAGTPWYEEIHERYADGRGGAWDDVVLAT